jgi:cysteinyl-tRNA synthetase
MPYIAHFEVTKRKPEKLYFYVSKKKPEKLKELIACRKALQLMGDHCGLFARTPETALLQLRNNAVKRLNLNVDEIEKLLAERTQARADKNWAVSDEIRDKLAQMGVNVLDRPEGSTWQVD